MTTIDKTADAKLETVRDPRTRSVIEQIFYYENQHDEAIATAGNDNAAKPAFPGAKKQATVHQGSDCFQSWALPEYLR